MLEGEEVFECDRSHFRTDICNIKGDIHTDNVTNSVLLYAVDPGTFLGKEKVKPYTRKWEKSCMDTVHAVTLRSVSASRTNPIPCDVRHKVPGIIFSTGGYTGNLYHEFHDGLIPLFITTQHLKGEVVLLISEFHDWWLMKYSEVMQQISHYPVIDFENQTKVHCFPEIEAGLHIHSELGIDALRMPNRESIEDFRELLNRAYKPYPGEVEERAADDIMPRLTIIVRSGTRVFLNLDAVVKVAEQIGYNVSLLKPDPTTELKKIFWLLNSTDVLMGVHGAALTHFLFMRPGTVFIQIIPLGTDWAAYTYYGEPAVKLGLQYVPYRIKPAESSLSNKYNATDPVLTDPASIVEKGWWTMKEIYLEGQDVRLSMGRMRNLFKKAKQRLKSSSAHS